VFVHPIVVTAVLALSENWIWAVLLAVIVIALVVPRKLAKRSSILDDPNTRRTAQEELRHSMDRLLIELQETARDINATIDTKMIALNRLIAEADQRIASLGDAAHAPVRAPGTQTEAPREAAPPAEPEPTGPEAVKRRALEREIFRLADQGKTELEIARLTDTPRGEVELVLSLRKTSGDDAPPGDAPTT